ncbi:hypothetical protein JTE90_009587 [Oedothorax gibbosus]|uniref:Cytochrome c oxidase assembly factor 3 n=1 Tax=Oedothorax gibbosus TaxID=931172 RepID=A0AAV6VIB6_9ARAC|nr:hypothetical protein JTE90_009587 [Oedothorax gibbosus]
MKNVNLKEGMASDLMSSLSEAQLMYMKRIEKENFERVAKLKKLRRNNILTGLGLFGSVFGIYLYSIFTVKQENFLDELDEKKTT